MLKITVSPLDSRNNSIPNSTPFSVEMMMSSSTAPPPIYPPMEPRRPLEGTTAHLDALRPRHLASGGHHGMGRVDPGDEMPAPAGAFLVIRVALTELAKRGDIDRLQELMVVLAHDAAAAIEHIELHVFKRGCDLDRFDRVGFFGSRLEHAHLVDRARIPERHVGLGAEGLLEIHRDLVAGIRNAFGDLEHLAFEAGLLDRGRAAGATGVIGVPVDLQPCDGGG